MSNLNFNGVVEFVASKKYCLAGIGAVACCQALLSLSKSIEIPALPEVSFGLDSKDLPLALGMLAAVTVIPFINLRIKVGVPYHVYSQVRSDVLSRRGQTIKIMSSDELGVISGGYVKYNKTQIPNHRKGAVVLPEITFTVKIDTGGNREVPFTSLNFTDIDRPIIPVLDCFSRSNLIENIVHVIDTNSNPNLSDLQPYLKEFFEMQKQLGRSSSLQICKALPPRALLYINKYFLNNDDISIVNACFETGQIIEKHVVLKGGDFVVDPSISGNNIVLRKDDYQSKFGHNFNEFRVLDESDEKASDNLRTCDWPMVDKLFFPTR